MTGDFNIDILNYEDGCENVRSFVYGLYSLNYLPSISQPTRFPVGAPSLIDHIWYNRLTQSFSGILLYDGSDHLPTFIQIKNYIARPIEQIKVSFRDHSSYWKYQ